MEPVASTASPSTRGRTASPNGYFNRHCGPRDSDEQGGLFDDYQLKLNSYDLGVDIELYDATQRLRFEHPEVKAVVVRSAKARVFCSGANIRMLAAGSHAHKVNFCKFTNETRNAIEDATACSGQTYLCAVTGTCAGGGYELALATDYIILADDGSSTVALPEVPLLAVLPGTGGLTRVTDKRKVRRDHADVFCTLEEGVKGQRAVDWRLVDEIVPPSRFAETVSARARAFAARSDRPDDAEGVVLSPLQRRVDDARIEYSTLPAEIDRLGRTARITVDGSPHDVPATIDAVVAEGAAFWPLRLARELDDLILHLRLNELEIGVLLFRSEGDADRVLGYDRFLAEHDDHWLVREIALYWKRVMKRIDLTSRSLVALVEPGSCFAGLLAEIPFACDRSYMLSGQFDGDNRPPATLRLTHANFGRYPMSNDLGRLETRFLGEPDSLERARGVVGEPLDAERSDALGLVTFAHDDIDWADEVRIFRTIPFGQHKGEPAWQQIPGEYRAMFRRLMVIQGDTEPASVEQQRFLGRTAPSLYDMRNLFQVNVEEGRHLWAMVYLLQKYFGRDGREEAQELLRRRSGDRDAPRLLGAFNEETPDWLSFFMFTFFTDRDGKMQLESLAQSGFDPLSRTCRFMLTEEAHHMFVGETGVGRIIQRTCEAMQEAGIADPYDIDRVRELGVIDLPTIENSGVDFRLDLPYLVFHREIGEFATIQATPTGEIVSDAEWQRRTHEFLPTTDDGDFIASLMKPVHEPGAYASWIQAPSVGIDNRPGDFEYVRIE